MVIFTYPLSKGILFVFNLASFFLPFLCPSFLSFYLLSSFPYLFIYVFISYIYFHGNLASMGSDCRGDWDGRESWEIPERMSTPRLFAAIPVPPSPPPLYSPLCSHGFVFCSHGVAECLELISVSQRKNTWRSSRGSRETSGISNQSLAGIPGTSIVTDETFGPLPTTPPTPQPPPPPNRHNALNA